MLATTHLSFRKGRPRASLQLHILLDLLQIQQMLPENVEEVWKRYTPLRQSTLAVCAETLQGLGGLLFSQGVLQPSGQCRDACAVDHAQAAGVWLPRRAALEETTVF
jgi:hypothetical protein